MLLQVHAAMVHESALQQEQSAAEPVRTAWRLVSQMQCLPCRALTAYEQCGCGLGMLLLQPHNVRGRC